jgi:hypothetical protein
MLKFRDSESFKKIIDEYHAEEELFKAHEKDPQETEEGFVEPDEEVPEAGLLQTKAAKRSVPVLTANFLKKGKKQSSFLQLASRASAKATCRTDGSHLNKKFPPVGCSNGGAVGVATGCCEDPVPVAGGPSLAACGNDATGTPRQTADLNGLNAGEQRCCKATCGEMGGIVRKKGFHPFSRAVCRLTCLPPAPHPPPYAASSIRCFKDTLCVDAPQDCTSIKRRVIGGSVLAVGIITGSILAGVFLAPAAFVGAGAGVAAALVVYQAMTPATCIYPPSALLNFP